MSKRDPGQREVSMDLNVWPEPEPPGKLMEPSRALAVQKFRYISKTAK